MAWQISPLAFATRHLGQEVDSPGGIGGECVDLANAWLAEAYGQAHVYRNAIEWGTRAIPGFRFISNAATNAPAAGDLVVWGFSPAAGIGPNGHIALALAADGMHLLSLDQNWAGRVATLELHSYRDVLGWQHKT